MASGETMNSVEPMSLPKILNLQSALSVPAAQLLALAKAFASEAADFLGRAVQARVLPASQLLLLVIERLEILVKSLKSLKAPSSEVNQLRRLVLKILRAKKKGWTEWTQLEELFEECEQALRAFSGRLPPQPRRKVSFWK